MRLKKTRGNRRRSTVRRRTVKFQGVMDTVLRKQGWSDKFQERRIFEAWESVVGTMMASQCVPISISGGVLKVAVSSPSWAEELSYLKTSILSDLQEKIDSLNKRMHTPVKKYKLTDIRSFLDSDSNKRTIKETGKSDAEVSNQVLRSVPPEMKDRIEAAVSVVNDVELRETLKTLFITQYCYTEPQNDKQALS